MKMDDMIPLNEDIARAKKNSIRFRIRWTLSKPKRMISLWWLKRKN